MTDRTTDCGSVRALCEREMLDETVADGMLDGARMDGRRSLAAEILDLLNTECRSVADELAEAKGLIWKIRHICARPSGPSDLDRIMRLVDQYGATRSLEPGEATEQESKDGA